MCTSRNTVICAVCRPCPMYQVHWQPLRVLHSDFHKLNLCERGNVRNISDQKPSFVQSQLICARLHLFAKFIGYPTEYCALISKNSTRQCCCLQTSNIADTFFCHHLYKVEYYVHASFCLPGSLAVRNSILP